MPTFEPADAIRAAFAAAMSAMYREEVPLYRDLIEIVDAVNATAISGQADLGAIAQRLHLERHGAIRVGTAAELAVLARIFAVMGMYPVDYYDLSVAGVPVHSTAFRPVDAAALEASPFRVFTSLLRLELIADERLRRQAETILAERCIVSPRALALLEQAEREGGLSAQDAQAFVQASLETFRWHEQACVSHETYARLHAAHRLIADVVSFKGPHINHLTPRTLDIDAAQAAMLARGIEAKSVIEGPPARKVPILLRQTSFTALEEPVCFAGQADGAGGTHTARFGEIEQRGLALTPAGRRLYDVCLAAARAEGTASGQLHEARLVTAFADFPDDFEVLRRQGLAHARYGLRADHACVPGTSLDEAIAQGWLVAQPLLYEDFLPVSAAGIFASNLGEGEPAAYAAQSSRQAFEAALGHAVIDSAALYATMEAQSLADVEARLGFRFAQQTGAGA